MTATDPLGPGAPPAPSAPPPAATSPALSAGPPVRRRRVVPYVLAVVVLVVGLGGRAVRAGDALCGCDDRCLALQRQAQEALANGDVAAFNALADQINTEAANGNDALRRLDAAVASLP